MCWCFLCSPACGPLLKFYSQRTQITCAIWVIIIITAITCVTTIIQNLDFPNFLVWKMGSHHWRHQTPDQQLPAINIQLLLLSDATAVLRGCRVLVAVMLRALAAVQVSRVMFFPAAGVSLKCTFHDNVIQRFFRNGLNSDQLMRVLSPFCSHIVLPPWYGTQFQKWAVIHG